MSVVSTEPGSAGSCGGWLLSCWVVWRMAPLGRVDPNAWAARHPRSQGHTHMVEATLRLEMMATLTRGGLCLQPLFNVSAVNPLLCDLVPGLKEARCVAMSACPGQTLCACPGQTLGACPGQALSSRDDQSFRQCEGFSCPLAALLHRRVRSKLAAAHACVVQCAMADQDQLSLQLW